MNEVRGPQIGDAVYQFDEHRRVYDKDCRIIYREYFRRYFIVGEEGRSWILTSEPNHPSAHRFKIGKQTVGKGKYHTEQQMEDRCWTNEHRHKIVEIMRSVPAETLRRIAAVVGYRP